MTGVARDARQLGNLIRRARKQRGWSQQQLGETAGFRQETISLLESGNPNHVSVKSAVEELLEQDFSVNAVKIKLKAVKFKTGGPTRI